MVDNLYTHMKDIVIHPTKVTGIYKEHAIITTSSNCIKKSRRYGKKSFLRKKNLYSSKDTQNSTKKYNIIIINSKCTYNMVVIDIHIHTYGVKYDGFNQN